MMPETALEALTLALQLAITAPTAELAERVTRDAEQLIKDAQLTAQQVETAKALALAITTK